LTVLNSCIDFGLSAFPEIHSRGPPILSADNREIVGQRSN